MIEDNLLDKYLTQFDSLKVVVTESTNRTVVEPVDPLFYDNQNVFIKSYLVSSCSILEAYIQDLAESYLIVLQARVSAANLPYNFVIWLAEYEKAKLSYEPFKGKKTRKDINDMISPNYFKTLKAFERIGVDVSTPDVDGYKDFISSIVVKRNKIVHHNDSASDLSFADIIAAIEEFKKYARCLFEAVRLNPHLNQSVKQ